MKRGNVHLIALAFLSIGSSFAFAQEATEVLYPQDRVRGGAVASRRPGLQVSQSISNFVTRQNSIFNDHGGAQIPAAPDQTPGQIFLTTMLQAIFDTLQGFADALNLLAQSGGLSGGTTTPAGS